MAAPRKTSRVLAVLEALQDRGVLTGPQLAARLGVDVRTVRRDIASLQDLGVPVQAARGRGGGYRLRPGYRMPPLMLTVDEAATVAVGLLGARRDGLDAGPALDKVRRVLPDATRAGVEALERVLAATGTAGDAAPPSGERLLTLAQAALRGRRVRARYATAAGEERDRELSPWGVVVHAGRWYVPAFDHDRAAPRALRADRFTGLVRVGGPGTPPDAGFDPVAFVSRTLARVPYAHRIDVLLDAAPGALAARFPPTLAELTATADGRTRLRMRADSPDWVAGLLAGAGCGLEVLGPPELRDACARLAERMAAAGVPDQRR